MEQFLDLLLKSGTTAAFVVGVLGAFTKKLLDRLDESGKQVIQQMNLRIDTLERASRACDDDRKKLHEELVSLASGKRKRTRTATKTRRQRKKTFK